MEQVIKIEENGDVTTLVNKDFMPNGEVEYARASHVEPDESDGNKSFYVKMSDDPRNKQWAGKVIGRGFKKYEDAIAFEIDWINTKILGLEIEEIPESE